MLSPSKKFNKIQSPVSQLLYTQAKEGGGGGAGEGRRYPGFQVTGKIKMGAKIKSLKNKIPSASNKTQKNPGHAELPSHKSLFAELSLHASCIIKSIILCRSCHRGIKYR